MVLDAERARLDELFTALLSKVMAGSVRAGEIDTSTLADAPVLGEPAA